MNIKVLANQSVYDLAIQATGDVANVMIIASVNDISVTDELKAGDVLLIPDTVTPLRAVLGYYTARQLKPATGLMSEAGVPQDEGIEFWYIEQDFVVS